MNRNTIMRKKIADEAQREATFDKKVDELLKEANELSTLCGVQTSIVVHKEGEDNAIMWPSPGIFNESLQKFLNFPEPKRAEGMTMHVDFVEQLVAAEARKVAVARERLQMRKAQQLLAQVTTGQKRMEELDFHQLQGLASFASEMLRKIGDREKELEVEGSGSSIG
ncbi:MADS-box transcription factor family protein [Striga asiatica]|uniref:MADS-box transcription factor family protein n=1 Tax=Striga asiatica TaxID=4170 RepID=A0A5A7QKU7_STRAF|nr:MADS-box transcription factor family protein [Striga asiatica]